MILVGMGSYYSLYSFFDEGMIILFWGFILSFFIKRMLFSSSLIEEAVAGLSKNNPVASSDFPKTDNTTSAIFESIPQEKEAVDIVPEYIRDTMENLTPVQENTTSYAYEAKETPEVVVIPDEPSKL